MEESQWVLLLFQLKTIIPDLDWGRKINFWSFSSVNLNVEPVTLPSTCHLPDNPPPLLYPHLIPQPKMKERAQKESGREGEKKGRKIQKETFAQHQNTKSILYFPTWLHGCCLSLPKYGHNPQRKTLRNLNPAFGIQIDIKKNKIYMGAGRDICPLLPIRIR